MRHIDLNKLMEVEMIITIDMKTPSINHLYLQRGYHKFLTKEAKDLKKYIDECILENTELDERDRLRDKKLRVEVIIYENWETKKGDVARKDVSNREKFLIDSIFNSLGLDDKYIFAHSMFKIQSSEEEKAVVYIEEVMS